MLYWSRRLALYSISSTHYTLTLLHNTPQPHHSGVGSHLRREGAKDFPQTQPQVATNERSPNAGPKPGEMGGAASRKASGMKSLPNQIGMK